MKVENHAMSTHPDRQGRTSYQPAKLNKVQGFAIAHLERVDEAESEVVAGIFKGERTFFQAHAHTSRKMTYEGFVEHESLIYYAVVRVQVEVQTRQAKFKAVTSPLLSGSGSPMLKQFISIVGAPGTLELIAVPKGTDLSGCL